MVTRRAIGRRVVVSVAVYALSHLEGLYLLDLFPTLLERAGVEVPAGQHGQSINPLLDGEAETHRDSIFSAFQSFFGAPAGRPHQRSVKRDGFKLIESTCEGQVTWQLFDLDNDPWELRNLVDDEAQSARVAALRQLLREAQTRYADPARSTPPV